MLDLSNLSQITDGDKKLMSELIKTFLHTTREDIKHLESAISQHQTKDISSLAHRIKGGAAIVGASELYSLAENLEHSPKQCLKENSTLLSEIQKKFHSIEKLHSGF